MSIAAEKIGKSYDGKPALQDVTCEIADGSFVTFLAPTGEGKTTLLRILAGVERPDRGRIYCDGKDVTDVPVQKRNVAMVYQWFVNYPSMTVYENIACPLRVSAAKHSDAQVDEKVRDTAARLKIDGLLDRRPSELSGGQQQRLALARALAKDADYVFLDEPLTNLDYKLQEDLRAELKRLFERRARGAVVLASPQPVEALTLATAVGFLKGGRLLQSGPTDEVYSRPAHLDVAAYFSHPAINLLDCRLVRRNGDCRLAVTDSLWADATPFRDRLAEGEYVLGVRPHALTSRRETDDALPVNGRVELAEVLGSDTELHLKHEGRSLIAWVQGVGSYAIGANVTVYMNPRRFLVFEKATGRLVACTEAD
jgi:glycerol transport system ATP-binding protein